MLLLCFYRSCDVADHLSIDGIWWVLRMLGGGVENDVMGTRERCGPELSIGSAAALLLHQSPKVFFTFIRSFPPQLGSLLLYSSSSSLFSLCVSLLFHLVLFFFTDCFSLFLLSCHPLPPTQRSSSAVQQFSTLIFNREKLLLRWNEYS